MNRCFLVSFVAAAVLLASQPSVVDAAHVAEVDDTNTLRANPNIFDESFEHEETARAIVINPDMKHDVDADGSVFEVVEAVMKAQKEEEDAAAAKAPKAPAEEKVENITAAAASSVDEPGAISPVVEGAVVEEGSSTQNLDAPRISSELLPKFPVQEAAASVHAPTQEKSALSQGSYVGGDGAGGGGVSGDLKTSAEVGAEPSAEPSRNASSPSDESVAAAKEALNSAAAQAKAAGVTSEEVMAVAKEGADSDSTQDSTQASEESSDSSSGEAIGSQEKLENTKAHAVKLGDKVASASTEQLKKFVCSEDPDIPSMTKCVKNNIAAAMDVAAAKIANNSCSDLLYVDKKEEPRPPCEDPEAQWIGEDMAERALYGNGAYSDVDPPLYSDLPPWTNKDKSGEPISSIAMAPKTSEVADAAADSLDGAGGSKKDADSVKNQVEKERQAAFGKEGDYKRILNGEPSDFVSDDMVAKAKEDGASAGGSGSGDGGTTQKGATTGGGGGGITLNGGGITLNGAPAPSASSLTDSSTGATLSEAAALDKKAAAAKKLTMDAFGSQELSQKVGEIVQEASTPAKNKAPKRVQSESELSDIEEGLV